MRRVSVKWIDIEARDEWQDFRECCDWVKEDFPVCETLGWLVYESDDRIGIVSCTFGEDDDQGSGHKIPRGNIVEIVDI